MQQVWVERLKPYNMYGQVNENMFGLGQGSGMFRFCSFEPPCWLVFVAQSK